MKVIILCGGKGARMSMAGERDDSAVIPKPMVKIGNEPILTHIMGAYRRHGFKEFILATGYKGELIRDYYERWPGVTVRYTGADTMTGGRVMRCSDLILEERFCLTYGDGLSDIDLGAELRWHEQHGRLATVAGVAVRHPMGLMDCENDGRVLRFREKPRLDGYGNGGFYIFERRVLEYLGGDACVLEQRPLERLAAEGELACYRHDGWWGKMDTHSEWLALNELWERGAAPWVSK